MENIATSNYIQRGLEARHKLELAKALQARIAAAQPDPNQMVSGRVVPISPLAMALNTFTGGIADSQAKKAEQEQGAMEDQRKNSLVQALSGGGKVTPELLANYGASPDDLLKLALAQDKGQQIKQGTPGMGFIPAGAVPFKDKETGFVGYKLPGGELIPSRFAMNEYQAAMTDPEHRGEVAGAEQQAREAARVHQVETMDGPQFRTGSDLVPSQPQQQPQQESAMDAIKRVESSGDINAVSPAGARGPYQIMPETAANPGYGTAPLPPNATPEQQKHFANEYILNLAKANPDWTFKHLMSAYNMGPGNVAKGKMNHSYENKVLGITPQQKADIAVSQKQGELQAETDAKRKEADLKLFESDPQRKATYETMEKNSGEYLANLEKYKAQVGNNPLLSNNPVYNFRAALGTDPVIANIESQTQGFVQDQIKAMQAMGLSPTQMMNTETEAKRFMQSVAGNGNAEAKINAFNRYKAAKDADMKAYEESRKAAAERLGKEYQPLMIPAKKPPTVEELLLKHGAK
jgi:hypothetical protein